MAHRFGPRQKNTTRDGYGYTHQQARLAAAARHQIHDPCARCQQPLGPMGPWLHYDHNRDRTGYLGFSHGRCNVSAGATEGNRRAREGRRRLPTAVRRAQSRAW